VCRSGHAAACTAGSATAAARWRLNKPAKPAVRKGVMMSRISACLFPRTLAGLIDRQQQAVGESPRTVSDLPNRRCEERRLRSEHNQDRLFD